MHSVKFDEFSHLLRRRFKHKQFLPGTQFLFFNKFAIRVIKHATGTGPGDPGCSGSWSDGTGQTSAERKPRNLTTKRYFLSSDK